MKKNILTTGLLILLLFAFSTLLANITKPIAEGEKDLAPIAIEFDLIGNEVKAADVDKETYARRPEIFTKAYRHHYLEAVKKFPNENVDVRNINVTRKNYDKKKGKTNFTSNARVIVLPEGTFSEAKALCKPMLEDEKEFIKGALNVDFRRPGQPHEQDVPFDVGVHDQAYTSLLQKAQEQYGPTADVRDMKITVKNKDNDHRTTYGATAIVIVK